MQKFLIMLAKLMLSLLIAASFAFLLMFILVPTFSPATQVELIAFYIAFFLAANYSLPIFIGTFLSLLNNDSSSIINAVVISLINILAVVVIGNLFVGASVGLYLMLSLTPSFIVWEIGRAFCFNHSEETENTTVKAPNFFTKAGSACQHFFFSKDIANPQMFPDNYISQSEDQKPCSPFQKASY